APFALAVRCLSPSTDGSYNQQVRYSVGADDTGVAPTTPLVSALVQFDICPGSTVIPSTGFGDTVFNNVKVFSLSFGGTNTLPGWKNHSWITSASKSSHQNHPRD